MSNDLAMQTPEQPGVCLHLSYHICTISVERLIKLVVFHNNS